MISSVLPNHDINMNKEELVSYVKEWLRLEKELVVLKKEVRDRRTKQGNISQALINIMKSNEIDSLDTNDGNQILYTQRKTKSAMTKTRLSNILQQYYKDTEEASQLLDFIMEKQEVKIKDNIRLKAEKKNE